MRDREQVLKLGSLASIAGAGDQVAHLYSVVDADGTALSRRRYAAPVAKGGTSIVYRVLYRGFADRALKLLYPRDDLKDVVLPSEMEASFQNEQRILQEITHERVGKVLDFGTLRINGAERTYIVMEYIEGRNLRDALTSRLDGPTFMSVMEQTIEGVRYLHKHHILHCDIKPANIALRMEDEGVSAVVLDLGVAHVVTASTDQLFQDAGTTYLFGNDRYIVPPLRPYLRHQSGARIPRSELAKFFPSQDLYSLGVIVGEALADDGLAGGLREFLGERGLQALSYVRDRLDWDDGGIDYASAGDLLRDWQKLRPSYVAPLGLQELALATAGGGAVTTAQGRIGLTERLEQIVNHPLFHRLHQIPQLEFVYLAYPGAQHSRFHHGLNAYGTARLFVGNLLNDSRFRLKVDPGDIEAVLTIALLHDVGHFPLSHMFEDFASAEADDSSRMFGRTLFNDDDVTAAFLRLRRPGWARSDGTTSGDLFESLLALGDGVVDAKGRSMSALLEDVLSTQAVTRLSQFHEFGDPVSRILGGIISSPCDADKVSYLSDDSLMTGVSYGLSMDTGGFLSALICPQDSELSGDRRTGVLAFTEKGVAAAESIVLARYWMIRRVYWHHSNRAVMAMVKFVIRALLERGLLSPLTYLESTLFLTQNESISLLVRLYERASESDDTITRECPIRGLQSPNRQFYHRLLSFSRESSDSIDASILDHLTTLGPMNDSHILRGMEAIVRRETVFDVRQGDILLDVPFKKRESTGGIAYVYDSAGQECLGDLTKYSLVIASFQREFDLQTKMARVVISPRLYEHLVAGESIARVQILVRELLFEHVPSG